MGDKVIRKFIVAISIGVCIIAHAQPPDYMERALLVFLDDQENDLFAVAPIAWWLFSALEQGKAPILVSKSSLKLLSQACCEIDERIKNKDEAIENNVWVRFQGECSAVAARESGQDKILTELKEWAQSNQELFDNLAIKEHSEAVLANRTFNPERWLAFEHDDLYLIFPHPLLESYGLDMALHQGEYTEEELDDFHLYSGLQLAHFRQVPHWFTQLRIEENVAEQESSEITLSSDREEKASPGTKFLKNLEKIFVPRKVYREAWGRGQKV